MGNWLKFIQVSAQIQVNLSRLRMKNEPIERMLEPNGPNLVEPGKEILELLLQ
jgi:hypothetical protein